MGVKGIIISAVCVAVGMALSLPTKMYLTFLLVKREADKQGNAEQSRALTLSQTTVNAAINPTVLLAAHGIKIPLVFFNIINPRLMGEKHR